MILGEIGGGWVWRCDDGCGGYDSMYIGGVAKVLSGYSFSRIMVVAASYAVDGGFLGSLLATGVVGGNISFIYFSDCGDVSSINWQY